jgi:hypothetical protein
MVTGADADIATTVPLVITTRAELVDNNLDIFDIRDAFDERCGPTSRRKFDGRGRVPAHRNTIVNVSRCGAQS